MAGQKFQYDESGNTSLYFFVSFLVLLLIPVTYLLWPRKRKDNNLNECQCDVCKVKRNILLLNEPWKRTKEIVIKVLIVLGWVALIFVVYNASQYENEYKDFDPYDILGISEDSSQAEIRKSYRKLSLIFHPDKDTGDEKAFVKITKAYQTLTDKESFQNWQTYGNPDGPGAVNFGIALPSWIVEEENSVWVLLVYGLLFMVALPVIVGMWWYKSIRYSSEHVLLDTTNIYFYFIRKTPSSMSVKRAIMILAASLEFWKRYNNEVVERVSDNVEVPLLIKMLPYLNEKNRENPLQFPYSVKARCLIHAHLGRIPLNPETLEKDRQYVIKKCPYLVQEMLNCVSHFIALTRAHHIARQPNIETLENIMKLSPMIIQAIWDNRSPLLQLPHVSEEDLKYFTHKKKHIKTIQQFISIEFNEQRQILRNFSDEQYNDIMRVLSKMPLVDFEIILEVKDDENSTVYTAGAIITVTVTLIRNNLCNLLEEDYEEKEYVEESHEEDEEQQNDDVESEKNKEQSKKPLWQKPQKKGKKVAKKNVKKMKQVMKHSHKIVEVNGVEKDKNEESAVNREVEENNSSSDSEGSSREEKEVKNGDDEDTEWLKFQSDYVTKREKALEGHSKESHSVHCPYYPDDKQEGWWVYIADRRNRSLITPPYYICNLKTNKNVELKFAAPHKPGLYTYTACLRSDSYVGFDQMKDIKLDVQKAPDVVEDSSQWENPDEEKEKSSGTESDLSEYATDDDVE